MRGPKLGEDGTFKGRTGRGNGVVVVAGWENSRGYRFYSLTISGRSLRANVFSLTFSLLLDSNSFVRKPKMLII